MCYICARIGGFLQCRLKVCVRGKKELLYSTLQQRVDILHIFAVLKLSSCVHLLVEIV